jgi:hypothetical protein
MLDTTNPSALSCVPKGSAAIVPSLLSSISPPSQKNISFDIRKDHLTRGDVTTLLASDAPLDIRSPSP